MLVQFYVDKKALCLEFPYNERLIGIAKSIPGAHWVKKQGRWEYPATEYIYYRIKEGFKIEIDDVESKLKYPKTVKISKHQFKTKPFDHQIEAMKFILEKLGVKVI